MNFKLKPCAAAVAGLLALSITGCASTGDYAADPILVPTQYDGGAPATQPGQTLATDVSFPARPVLDDPWWKGFGDERLDRLVAQVLHDNSDLAAAGFTLRAARLSAGLAETDLWPTLDASVDTSASRALDRHDAVDHSSSASVSVSWEIDLWGKLRAQRDEAKWEAEATAEDLQNTALTLVTDTCNYYWELAYLNQSVADGERDLQGLEKTLQLVQTQYKSGYVSKLELREAEQNLEAARTSQSQLVQQRVETRNALTVLLDGKAWPQSDEPQNLDAASSPSVQPGLPAELLGRRPDLRAAEMRLRESLATIKATATSYYPALSLTGGISSGGDSLAEVLKNPVGTLGAGLSLPFLNIEQARLNTRIAGTDYQVAAAQFRTTLFTALQEVNNALSAREQLAQQLESAQKSYDAAVDVEHMYEIRYRTGYTDLRTWLDAQQTLRESELSLAQVKYNMLSNDATLVQALGGSASLPGADKTAGR